MALHQSLSAKKAKQAEWWDSLTDLVSGGMSAFPVVGPALGAATRGAMGGAKTLSQVPGHIETAKTLVTGLAKGKVETPTSGPTGVLAPRPSVPGGSAPQTTAPQTAAPASGSSNVLAPRPAVPGGTTPQTQTPTPASFPWDAKPAQGPKPGSYSRLLPEGAGYTHSEFRDGPAEWNPHNVPNLSAPLSKAETDKVNAAVRPVEIRRGATFKDPRDPSLTQGKDIEDRSSLRQQNKPAPDIEDRSSLATQAAPPAGGAAGSRDVAARLLARGMKARVGGKTVDPNSAEGKAIAQEFYNSAPGKMWQARSGQAGSPGSTAQAGAPGTPSLPRTRGKGLLRKALGTAPERGFVTGETEAPPAAPAKPVMTEEQMAAKMRAGDLARQDKFGPEAMRARSDQLIATHYGTQDDLPNVTPERQAKPSPPKPLSGPQPTEE